jgi:elongation factor 1-gamma
MPATQASIGVLHYVPDAKHKAHKALIAAKFNGIALTEQAFDLAKDAKKPAFAEFNPLGKVPFLQTDTGCIASSNAIARYVARCRADTSLYGKSFDDEGQIDTWMEFCTYELEIPLAVWLYPVLGLMAAPEASKTENAKTDVKKALQALEDKLKTSPFLVGDFISLADIVVACALKEGFVRLFDPAFRKPYAKVCAWFEGCCKMPQFSAVIGAVTLCKEAEKPKAVATPAAPKAEAKKEDKKADKKAEAKKEAAKPKAEAKAKAPAEPKPKKEASPPEGASLSPEQVKAVQAIGDEIRVLKERLKAEGITGQKLNTHPEIVDLVAKLNAARAPGQAPAPAASPPTASGGGDIDAQVKEVGEQIRELKAKLKGQGLSGKKIDASPEVKELVTKLQELKAQQK